MTLAGAKRKASFTASVQKKPRKTLESFFSPKVSIPRKQDVLDSEPSHVALNVEQTRVLRMVVDGRNLFFTGAAGTGKSLLLRAIINTLRKKYGKDKDAVSITASTGMAASNIGGMTIHSWGAVTPNCQDVDSIIKCIRTCKPALERWKKTKVLVIDEVSMVDGQLFEQLAAIATKLRKKTEKPFGGMQVIVTGDFFQLPPVTKNNQEPIFAFESPAWKSTLTHTINLTRVFRQKDSKFIAALNSLREGAPSDETNTLFTSLSRPLKDSNILPTELFPLRDQVAKSNAKRLHALPSKSITYLARDSGEKPMLLQNLLAEREVELKVDAQVMLIKNVDDVLVNGVVGKVVGFYHPNQLVGSSSKPSSKAEPGTLKDSTKSFYAASPSASSSTVSLAGASKTQLSKPTTETKKNGALLRHVLLHDDGRTPVMAFAEQVDKENQVKPGVRGKANANVELDDRYPLVVFEYPLQDDSGRTATEAVLIKRDEFRVEDREGKVIARRLQLPLILAWAMSIHKSQGQTLHRVKVDLGRVFERGQSYVALSRASSLDGLQVIGFNPKKVMAHPKVIEWSKTLQQGSDDDAQ